MSIPDRYTTLSVHRDDLPARIAEAKNLGLEFLVTPENHPASERVYLYLFFDSRGMDNYLKGVYSMDSDEIFRIASEEPDNAELGVKVRKYFKEAYG